MRVLLKLENVQHTSIYDTSIVKLILGSAALLSSTRTNNSEHVKGIIPLSGPSSGVLYK